MRPEWETPLETQVDRTVLSWGRTAATVAVVALLFARWAEGIGPIAFLPAAVGLGAAVGIGLLPRAQARRRRMAFASAGLGPPVWMAAGLCAISVLLAGAGLLAVLLD